MKIDIIRCVEKKLFYNNFANKLREKYEKNNT